MSKINYEPRGDRVIVKQLTAAPQQEGQVFLPDSQRKPLNEGIVIAVGPGVRNRFTGMIDPVDLTEGDHVCFLEFAGFEIIVDGEAYISMRNEEVHGRRLAKPVTLPHELTDPAGNVFEDQD